MDNERFNILYEQGKLLSERLKAMVEIADSDVKRVLDELHYVRKAQLDVELLAKTAHIKLDALLLMHGINLNKPQESLVAS